MDNNIQICLSYYLRFPVFAVNAFDFDINVKKKKKSVDANYFHLIFVVVN